MYRLYKKKNTLDSRRGRVLVVDDDATILDLLTAYIRRFDIDVSQAENGRDAWSQFNHEPFDLVITDLQMPEMNGLALCEKIREQSRDTPIVIITGNCMGTDVDEEMTVLRKPFKLASINRILGDIFDISVSVRK